MSIKLEDGRWYLIRSKENNTEKVIKASVDPSENILTTLGGYLPDSVEIISEMAPVKQEEPEYEYVKVSFDEVYLAAESVFDGHELFIGYVGGDGRPTGEFSDKVCQSRAAANYDHLYRRVKADKRQKFIDECKVRFGKVTTDSKCIFETIHDELVK